MTNLSNKCQYAIRAIYELALRKGEGTPTPVSEIAQVQKIPPRFLELILGQLKQAGFVESRRGVQGGYLLVSDPAEVTVGQIIREIEGSTVPVECIASDAGTPCPLEHECPFQDLWRQAHQAVSDVYESTSFATLIANHRRRTEGFAPDYSI